MENGQNSLHKFPKAQKNCKVSNLGDTSATQGLGRYSRGRYTWAQLFCTMIQVVKKIRLKQVSSALNCGEKVCDMLKTLLTNASTKISIISSERFSTVNEYSGYGNNYVYISISK